ncbi:unnamed protein product [Periconia digitata]|uniref:Alpha N-terminal protein methyltransferase 1 n=1 Tax=Periconia digitata TaxID=1303443 RepID=A0A9W4ULI2_9PLEO|nr:unnamed protein product [Periconia digitata]
MAMDMDPPINPTSPTDNHDEDDDAPDALIDPAASLTYWNSVSADTTGMLGGFPQTSRIDLQGSHNFLTKLRRSAAAARQKKSTPSNDKGRNELLPQLGRAADCGAGVGRVTNGFLRNVAAVVDVVEPVRKFTDALASSSSSSSVGGPASTTTTTPQRQGDKELQLQQLQGKIGTIVNLGLQDWTPPPSSYNLIWNQWCLGHLTDAQLVAYLVRCKDGLLLPSSSVSSPSSGGGEEAWIVVKENLSTDPWGKDIYDEVDSSVTRSDAKFRELFAKAGLRVVRDEVQRGFPRDLFPVRMYALRP